MSRAANAPAARRSRQLARRQERIRRQGCRDRKAYATDPNGPYVYYYRSLFTKLKKGGRLELFKTARDQPDDEVTLESICEKLIIHGTPDRRRRPVARVSGRGGQLRHAAYAGKDWKDRELGRNR
jgi:hypothetical protein